MVIPFGVLLILVVLVVLARGLHPVSFPNLEVKPFCADGTATGGLWESRALPTVSLNGGGGVDPLRVDAPTTFFVCVSNCYCFLCVVGLCLGVVVGTTPHFFMCLWGTHR